MTASNGVTVSSGNVTLTTGNVNATAGTVTGSTIKFGNLVGSVASCATNALVSAAITAGNTVINYTSGADDLDPTVWAGVGTDGQVIFIRAANFAQSTPDIQLDKISTFVRIGGAWYQTSN